MSALSGVRPVRRKDLLTALLAGATLAAVGVPEVLGYALIAGMPLVTGLYTMLIPLAVFAVLGSSRHLVVAADSATAAILAAGIGGLAATGSPDYQKLVGLAALSTGVLLVIARVIRLGLLADFLSRTVLIGFLTGVGFSIAAGQLPDLLGIEVTDRRTLPRLAQTVTHLSGTSLTTLAVGGAVLLAVPLLGRLTRRVPGALVAVIAAIVLSEVLDLARHGVRVLGQVPRGLPSLTVPALSLSDIGAVLPTTIAVVVVVLAQSSATSRAYAARYGERVDEGADLIGLGAANVAAAFTGTFVVNGSPTKTEVVDSAGGRSQLAQLASAVVVLFVLLFATGPLAKLPVAVVSAIVLLIGASLIDVPGLRRVLALRVDEFVVAVVTAVAVIVVGVEQGIALAIVASTIDHLRHSYRPPTYVLVRGADNHWQLAPARPATRTAAGLVIYRFPSNLYYANAQQLAADMRAFLASAVPLTGLCFDAAGIADVDFTAAETLRQVLRDLRAAGVRIFFTSLSDEVARQLRRYGLVHEVDAQLLPTPGALLDRWTHPEGDGMAG